jgi:hypothetical protein
MLELLRIECLIILLSCNPASQNPNGGHNLADAIVRQAKGDLAFATGQKTGKLNLAQEKRILPIKLMPLLNPILFIL